MLVEKLSGKDRSLLRSRGNQIRPTILVGKEGLGSQTLRSVEEGFNTTDLLKIKLQENAPLDPEAVVEFLLSLPDTFTIQKIGRTVLIYRPHPAIASPLNPNPQSGKGK